MQNYTSIPISNPPPRPAIPIAEGADQAVMQNKTNLQNCYHVFQEILILLLQFENANNKICSKQLQWNHLWFITNGLSHRKEFKKYKPS